ncbi:hypothetical protein M434DRAFT_372068 [Hypoxylon sp. CO27-5]|nr:hypothetical protein M434DRAFT_372068 [Hypoxylon sp. CO27-5]
MKVSWLTRPVSLAGLAAVSLAVSAQAVREWTVSNASRAKSQNNTLCNWHFTVTDSNLGVDTSNIFDCNFNVTAQPGSDCGLTSFQDYCSGDESFTANGGHSDLGFVVIVLENRAQKSQAFFGFSDGALDTASEIPQQTKPINPQAAVRRDEMVIRRDGGSNNTSATEWKVEDLFRGRLPNLKPV